MAQGEQNKMVQGGPTAKNTLQTAEWVPNQGLPVGKSFGIGQMKPFSEYHSKQNASFTNFLSFKKYKSFFKKFPQPPPQVYHQRTNCTKDPKRGERGENWPDFLPPRDYFGDNSSRDRKRRRSKFSGVRAFGKLLTEWLQLNNTAINPGCCCPTGIPLNVYTSPFD